MTPSRSLNFANGLEVLCHSRVEAEQFYADIFERNIYTSHGIEMTPGDIIFDVGANIGLFTLRAGQVPGVTIFSAEPAPDVYALLVENVARHSVNARCLNLGVGAHSGTKQFTYYPHSSGMSSFYGEKKEEADSLRAVMVNSLDQGGYSEEERGEMVQNLDGWIERRLEAEVKQCPITTISHLMWSYQVPRIDLLKIDVQKSEMDVLLGIDDVHWPHIRQIVGEVHKIGNRVEHMQTELKNRGYDVVVVQDDLYVGSAHYNLYASRRAPRLFDSVVSRAVQQRSIIKVVPRLSHASGLLQ
jgi:phthiocerol/phenolphthiocerol synthesis type-I polyketide synthase E